MSETVAISLITALAGFSGALLGALAAVVGPWWLRRSDRLATEKSGSLEARRLAIVEWLDSQISLMNHLEIGGTETPALAERTNHATFNLLSRFSREEDAVGKWMLSLQLAAEIVGEPGNREYFNVGGQMLLEWQAGVRSTEQVVPFIIVRSEAGRLQIDFGAWPS
jgi:hypothetical protein